MSGRYGAPDAFSGRVSAPAEVLAVSAFLRLRSLARYGSSPRGDAVGRRCPACRRVRHCEVCGACMPEMRCDARYCTNTCRQRAYRQRRERDTSEERAA